MDDTESTELDEAVPTREESIWRLGGGLHAPPRRGSSGIPFGSSITPLTYTQMFRVQGLGFRVQSSEFRV